MMGILAETMQIRNMVGDVIIPGSIIFDEIVTSNRQVIEKANEQSKQKYAGKRKIFLETFQIVLPATSSFPTRTLKLEHGPHL